MHVVGHKLNATAAIGQKPGADGLQITLHHRLTPQEAIEYLRHAGGDVVVFLCDSKPVGMAQPLRTTPLTPPSPAGGEAKTTDAMQFDSPLPNAGEDQGEGESAVADLNPSAPEGRSPLGEVSPRAEDLAKGGQPSTLPPQRGETSPRAGSSHELRVRDLTVNLITDIVRRGGKVIELTPLPLRLLKYLMFRAGETCSRKDILKEVCGYDFKPGSMAFLEVRINRLRAAIDKGFDTRMIHTVRDVGYKLTAEG